MTRDRSNKGRTTDNSSDAADPRYPTRRHFLATAVAGVGLAPVGVLPAETASEREHTSRKDVGPEPRTPVEHSGAEQGVERPEAPADPPIIGANLNGRPHRLLNKLELIDASETTWVRAFIDVRNKLADGGDPERDPDVIALRQAALERDCKLIVSLKWDFKANWGDKDPMTVPPPGTDDERALFQTASKYLASIGAPIEIVVLGNEPMWETLDEDIKVDDPPIVEFTRNAKDYLVRHGDHGDSTYLVGAFNRTHDAAVRSRHYPQFFQQMFDLVRDDADVDGVDLHLHYNELSEAESMVSVVRTALPNGMITATEFSPVWRYHRHVHTPIDSFETGERFALDHDLPAGMTAVDYFERAKRDPLTPEELADFYEAMPWYNVDHVMDMDALLAEYDVSIGTFGLLQSQGMRNEDWTADWSPFHINFLFQPALTRTDAGIEHTANRHYLEDYRVRARRGRSG